MARYRPRRALRPPLWARAGRLVVPAIAVLAVTCGVAVASRPAPPSLAAAPAAASVTPIAEDTRREERTDRISRQQPRPPSPPRRRAVPPEPKVIGSRYAQVALNVRAGADQDSRLVVVLPAGSRLRATDTVRDGWRLVLHRGERRWVKSRYLATRKPRPAGLSSAPCPGGSAVEAGLTADAVRVHRAICARFPQVTAYGGVRPDALPDHPSGRALDAMVPNSDLGWAIANWVRSHSGQLGVSEVIFAQRIWTVQRAGEGWRSMPDRGSASANHHDHVHVTVYG